MKINEVELTLKYNDPPFELRKRGWVHPAELVGSYESEEIRELAGKFINGFAIKGIESFATTRVSGVIGILTAERMW
jgi:hypothetical protein